MLILLCVVVCGAAALGFSLLQPKEYSATATLLFTASQPSQSLASVNGASAPIQESLTAADQATETNLVSLSSVAHATAAALRKSYPHLEPSVIQSNVAVSNVGTSNLVDVTATSPRPFVAAAFANAYAKQFITARVSADRAAFTQAEHTIDQQLKQTSSLSAVQRGQLQTQAQQLRLLSVMQTGNAQVAQQASVPLGPSSPKPVRNTVLGLVLGLVLGVALALLFERVDRRINDVDDLENTLDLPVLGTIPDSDAIHDFAGWLPPVDDEAFRMLSARLRYFNVDREISVITVVSAAPNDGKSTIAYHLARVATSNGARVVLVEVDLRKPRLARRLAVSNAPGVAELLTQPLSLADVVQSVPVMDAVSSDEDVRCLDLIVAGQRPPNPGELLESQKFADLLARLTEKYDLVVFDTPPTSLVADALPIMRWADGVLIVTRLGRSTTGDVTRLQTQLAELGAESLGIVINGLSRRQDYYSYGYRDASGYFDGPEIPTRVGDDVA